MSLPYKHNLIPRAKDLRKNATKQENHLWYDFLRTYPLRFQRQKTISGFIVDFYCHEAKLVVEVDGAQHYEEEDLAYDARRTASLERFGLTILRFTNGDINQRFSAVCEQIDHVVKESIASLSEGGGAAKP